MITTITIEYHAHDWFDLWVSRRIFSHLIFILSPQEFTEELDVVGGRGILSKAVVNKVEAEEWFKKVQEGIEKIRAWNLFEEPIFQEDHRIEIQSYIDEWTIEEYRSAAAAEDKSIFGVVTDRVAAYEKLRTLTDEDVRFFAKRLFAQENVRFSLV